MKNLNVRWKIMILTFVTALLMVAVGYSGYDATKKVSDASERMYNENVKAMAILDEIRANNLSMQSIVLELIVTTDEQKIAMLKDALEKAKESNNGFYGEIEKLSMSSTMKTQYDEFRTVVPDYRTALEEVVQLAEKNDNTQAYSVFTSKVQTLRQDMNDKLQALTELQSSEAASSSEQAIQLKNGSLILILSLLIAGIALSLVVGFLIAQAVANPLRKMQQMMQEAENGNLTVKADYASRDEIGQLSISFNGMIAGLRTIVQKVDESAMTLSASSEQLTASAEQTAVASGHIASSSSHLADGFEEQTQTVTQVTAAAEQLVDHMNNIRTGSETISGLSEHSERSARAGLDEVRGVLQQMQQIDSSVDRTGIVIAELEHRIQDIDNLVAAIQQVAKQTNLLALNASIEAARAGEAGRGFDVVAQEIRKLAESAAESASQITETVHAVQEESRKAGISMREAAGLVKQGVEGAGRASESFATIQESISDVSVRVSDISRSIASVSGQSVEIGRAMQSISRVTEQGASGLQEVSAASEEQLSTMEEVNGSARYLSQLAEDLQQELTKFQL